MTWLSEWKGSSVESWRDRWDVPHLEIFQHISSTNDRILEVAREGADSWSTVLAEAQSQGRGGGGVLTPWELQSYSERDALWGQKVECELEGTGVAMGLTPRGTLILERTGGGLTEVQAGSIRKQDYGRTNNVR